MKKADLILTSDWHIRENNPSCRTDNFEETQWEKIRFISKLQKEHDCLIFHAGDLFEHWKPSPYLLSKTMENLPNKFFTIYGNHDLPQHNLDLADKCGTYTLIQSKHAELIKEAIHWGEEYEDTKTFKFKDKRILIAHVMTYQGITPFPGCTDSPARTLIRKYKNCDLIITGHNHQSFVENHKDRILVNPGGITRQTSDQADFEPKVYLYYADDNKVEVVKIPHKKGVVIKPENVQNKEDRKERIDAFLSKLDSSSSNSIDFIDNIHKFLQKNDKEINKEVKEIILHSLE